MGSAELLYACVEDHWALVFKGKRDLDKNTFRNEAPGLGEARMLQHLGELYSGVWGSGEREDPSVAFHSQMQRPVRSALAVLVRTVQSFARAVTWT